MKKIHKASKQKSLSAILKQANERIASKSNIVVIGKAGEGRLCHCISYEQLAQLAELNRETENHAEKIETP